MANSHIIPRTGSQIDEAVEAGYSLSSLLSTFSNRNKIIGVDSEGSLKVIDPDSLTADTDIVVEHLESETLSYWNAAKIAKGYIRREDGSVAGTTASSFKVVYSKEFLSTKMPCNIAIPNGMKIRFFFYNSNREYANEYTEYYTDSSEAMTALVAATRPLFRYHIYNIDSTFDSSYPQYESCVQYIADRGGGLYVKFPCTLGINDEAVSGQISSSYIPVKNGDIVVYKISDLTSNDTFLKLCSVTSTSTIYNSRSTTDTHGSVYRGFMEVDHDNCYIRAKTDSDTDDARLYILSGVDSSESIISEIIEDFLPLDTSLTQDGKVADAAAVGNEMTRTSAFDILNFTNPSSNTNQGVTFTWTGKSCYVSGTAVATGSDANAWNYLLNSKNELPDYFVPGQTYYITYSALSTYFEVRFYENGSQIASTVTLTSKSFTVPSNAGGATIRLAVRNGGSASETVTPYITTAKRNETLGEETDDLITRVGALEETTGTPDVTLGKSGKTAEARAVGLAMAENGSFDILRLGAPVSGTDNGITYTFNSDGSVTVSGTATDLSRKNYWSSSTELPDYIIRDRDYYFVNDSNDVMLQWYFYDSNGDVINSSVAAIGNERRKLTVPYNAHHGTIRLRVLNGITVNTTIHPHIYSAETNAKLGIFLEETRNVVDEQDKIIDRYATDHHLTLTWSQGSISTDTGGTTTSSICVRTTDFYSLEDCGAIILNTISYTPVEIFKISLYFYSAADYTTYISDLTTDWIEGNDIKFGIPKNANYVRFVCAKSDNSEITPSTPGVPTDQSIYFRKYGVVPDISLSLPGKPADAQAVGTELAERIKYLYPSGADDTSAIVAELTARGVCYLSAGTFIVKNLDMPTNSTIIGSGLKTYILLDTNETSAYTIKLGAYCTVKDCRVMGATSSVTPTSTMGNRHGIELIGDYTASQTASNVYRGTLDHVMVSNFTGYGLYCYDTGGSSYAGLKVSNSWFVNCGAGIHLLYSGFHEFSNVQSRNNYYGVIINSTRNIFSNCEFTLNECAVKANSYNENDPVPIASASAMFNNCQFLFSGLSSGGSGTNSGWAIDTTTNITGTQNGASPRFTFTGCTFHSSPKIALHETTGIIFSACIMGVQSGQLPITVVNGGSVLFSSCLFATIPTVTLDGNTKTRMIDCYTANTGNPVTI